MRIIRLLCFVLGTFFLSFQTSSGQDTEWIYGVNNQNHTHYSQVIGDFIDSDNSYYSWMGQIPLSSFNEDSSYLTKYTTWGDSLWTKSFGLPVSAFVMTSSDELVVVSVCRSDTFYYQGIMYELGAQDYRVFVSRFDSAFNLVSSKLVVDQARNLFDWGISIDEFQDGDLLLTMPYSGFMEIDGLRLDSIPYNHQYSKGIFKLTNDAQPRVVWHHQLSFSRKSLIGTSVFSWVRNNQDIVLNTNEARVFYSGDDHFLDGQYFTGQDAIRYFDFASDGAVVRNWEYELNDSFQNIRNYTSDPEGHVLIAGLVSKNWLYTYKPGVQASTNYNQINFLTMYDIHGNWRWTQTTDTLGKSINDLQGNLDMGNWKTKNGFFYSVSSSHFYKGSFGGMDFTDPYTNRYTGFVRFLKLDTLGNFIWNLRLFGALPNWKLEFELDEYDNILFTGTFLDSLLLPDTTLAFPRSGQNHFASWKFGSLAIYRGPVSSGPYCAGDSLTIPFTIKGQFNQQNEFIAELSDEDGNFTGNHPELGRLTGNQSDTVFGVLPLLQVPSSPHYRIRLRSTSPSAQSFYKRDSLRLLIYSKDSANAGEDTLICWGEEVLLKTTGGSRWQWSPGWLVDDSTRIRTKTMPLTNTEFRIIISDSSGCGDTDTDYVYVEVREPLEIDSIQGDKDSFCMGETVTMKAFGHGGLTSGYRWVWSGVSDSLSLRSFKIYSDTSLLLVLKDGCTAKPDSLVVQAFARSKLKVLANSDSACFHDSIRFTANATGGWSPGYSMAWYKDNQFIGLGEQVSIYADSAVELKVVLHDGCTVEPDSSLVMAQPFPKYSLELGDSIGCSPFLFEPKLTPLNKVVYRVDWLVGMHADSGLSPSFELSRAGKYPASLRVNATFLCSLPITNLPLLQVEEAPEADFEIDPEWLDIHASDFRAVNVTKGKVSDFEWHTSIGAFSSQRSPIFSFMDTGNYLVTLFAYSPLGCLDSTSKPVRIHDIYSITIPNAFTPNSDRLNPVFEPVLTGFKSYKLEIYDRWGEHIFSSDNIPWNGTFKNRQVPAGVYHYRLDVRNEKGERFFYTGSVYVLY